MIIYKVLIADDERNIREGLKTFIPWKSFDLDVVELVDNGRKVVDYLANHTVDILLLDIQMPILSGLDVMKIVSAKYPKITSIILSGHADFQYAQKAISFGVTEYMLKPINIAHICEVLGKIKNSLDARREEDSDLLASKQLLDHVQNGSIQGTSRKQRIVDMAKEWIEQHYAEDFGLECMANQFRISKEYFSSIFKDETGENFVQYLKKVRMVKAIKLMKDNPDLRIYEISEQVGYRESKYFCRVFKIHYGQYPEEYRQRITTMIHKQPVSKE